MAKRKLTNCDAKAKLRRQGIDFNADFHTLSSGDVGKVVDVAREAGYRKSKSAPGSRGRMFFQLLARTKGCGVGRVRRRR